jgi:tRNA U38,U39,U40 pseudouridine synthase TruA
LFCTIEGKTIVLQQTIERFSVTDNDGNFNLPFCNKISAQATAFLHYEVRRTIPTFLIVLRGTGASSHHIFVTTSDESFVQHDGYET